MKNGTKYDLSLGSWEYSSYEMKVLYHGNIKMLDDFVIVNREC